MDIDQIVRDKQFAFMLKEYEMLYSKFEMHYSAVEKTVSIYILIIGGILSTNGFLMKVVNNFSVFRLNGFQIFCCFFISIVGTILTLKVMEHRLLIITYVKSLNLNRKWFFDNLDPNRFAEYSLFEASYKSPKYFKRYRHFYWEVLGLSLINSSFLSLFLINIICKIGVTSKYAELINWSFCVFVCVISTYLIIRYYKYRGEKEENKLDERNFSD